MWIDAALGLQKRGLRKQRVQHTRLRVPHRPATGRDLLVRRMWSSDLSGVEPRTIRRCGKTCPGGKIPSVLSNAEHVQSDRSDEAVEPIRDTIAPGGNLPCQVFESALALANFHRSSDKGRHDWEGRFDCLGEGSEKLGRVVR